MPADGGRGAPVEDGSCGVAGIARLGQDAPRVRLPDVHGRLMDVGAPDERPALLVFVPFAFSPVCSGEVDELAARADGLTGVRLLVTSCDPAPALRAWGEQRAYQHLDMLSDFWPHGAAARAYGAFDEATGHARRVTWLIDRDGVLRWRTERPGGRARDVGEYVDAVRGLVGAVEG